MTRNTSWRNRLSTCKVLWSDSGGLLWTWQWISKLAQWISTVDGRTCIVELYWGYHHYCFAFLCPFHLSHHHADMNVSSNNFCYQDLHWAGYQKLQAPGGKYNSKPLAGTPSNILKYSVPCILILSNGFSITHNTYQLHICTVYLLDIWVSITLKAHKLSLIKVYHRNI
jgi:hypothetical protein